MKTRRKTGTRHARQAVPAKRRAAGARPTQAAARKPAAKGASKRVALLAADCTIAQAGAMKSQLAKVLSASGAVTVDLSGVRRIDTAGFQVLAAFIRERRAAGRDVRCDGATEAFSVTASLLGLGALFGSVTSEQTPGSAGRA